MRSQLFLIAASLVGVTSIAALPRPSSTSGDVPAGPAAAHASVAGLPLAVAPSAEAETKASTADARVEAALGALSMHVAEQSHPDALRMAFQAYFNYQAAHPDQVRNPYFYYVDYGLDNRTPRGYVFDMKALKLVEGPFTVAHGRGSSAGRNGVPTKFTNRPGSASTSLGLYLAQETYGFSGKSGGRHYRSIGLRMRGLSGRFNSAARSRGVVAHGAPYVTARDAGRSEGCPAMEERRAQRLIPMIANGGLVFLFSPRDETWMREDPWARGGVAGGIVAES